MMLSIERGVCLLAEKFAMLDEFTEVFLLLLQIWPKYLASSCSVIKVILPFPTFWLIMACSLASTSFRQWSNPELAMTVPASMDNDRIDEIMVDWEGYLRQQGVTNIIEHTELDC
eukprot:1340289-Amphidinium_carterae.4